MRLVLNGEETIVPDDLTFLGLLAHLALDAGPVAIERNGEIVPRREHGASRPAEGDTLEIVHFVGGG